MLIAPCYMFGLKKYSVQLIELFSPTMLATSRRYSHVSLNCLVLFDIRFFDLGLNHKSMTGHAEYIE